MFYHIHLFDEIEIDPSDVPFRIDTNPEIVKDFLSQANGKTKIIFSTYQSGQVVSEAVKDRFEFDIAIFDEAHKTTGPAAGRFALALNDENVKIKKGKDEIALIGVENWGKHFGEFGDIDKATENVTATDFKILMSHDPSHWEYIVKQHPKNIQLTLSGHTHGMQFGIEIPGYFKWSLAKYIYKQWAGLYEEFGRYVYVNRGFGFHAYPGRVGIMPEITVFELKKGNIVA
jgi:predicted MPP superfamily phosphohydrolase